MIFDINNFLYDDFNSDFTKKIDILKELPYEVQFNEDDFYETFLNLYKYHENNKSLINDLPSPFYEDCIITEMELFYNIKIDDEEFYLDLDKYINDKLYK